MRLLGTAGILSVSIISAGCSGTTSASPSFSSTGPSSLTGDPTIGFNGLSSLGVPCSGPPIMTVGGGCGFTSYSESGVTVTATSGGWSARTGYGNPAPFIEFDAATTGAIHVTAGGATFTFKSVDLYASLAHIPYQITGLRNSATVFTQSDTLPGTLGDFVTVTNSYTTDVIDTLVIALTDSGGPMGVDNIVVASNQ